MAQIKTRGDQLDIQDIADELELIGYGVQGLTNSGTAPPGSPTDGLTWFNTANGLSYTWHDGTPGEWVQTSDAETLPAVPQNIDWPNTPIVDEEYADYNGTVWVCTGITPSVWGRKAFALANFVQLTGDTMTGNLNIVQADVSDSQISLRNTTSGIELYVDASGNAHLRQVSSAGVPEAEKITLWHNTGIDLLYASSKKFETTATGAITTGDMTATGHVIATTTPPTNVEHLTRKDYVDDNFVLSTSGFTDGETHTGYTTFADFDDDPNLNHGIRTFARDGAWHFDKDTGEVNDISILIEGGTVWHSGNDGHNSGLDADTLDGAQKVEAGGGSWAGVIDRIPHIRTDGVMEIGRYIDFHTNDSVVDYDMRLDCSSADILNVTGGELKVAGQPVMVANSVIAPNQYTFAFADSIADNAYNGLTIDHNMSGADVLTATRNHAALNIDVDSTATGGDTTNEHRIYGTLTNVSATGDSDLIYGNYAISRAGHTTGTVTGIYGTYGYAQGDSSGAGVTTSVFGGYFLAYDELDGTTANLYGVYGRSLKQATSTSTSTTQHGGYFEIETDEGSGNITDGYAVKAVIDNNRTTSPETAYTNAYLFYGDYQGTLPTNAFGVYIADNVPSFFGGTIDSGNIGVSQSSAISSIVSAHNTLGGTMLYASSAGDGAIGQTDSAGNWEKNCIVLARDSAVSLYYNGTVKFNTNDQGVNVDGGITLAGGLTGSLRIEDGNHAINSNDGGGNFNIRVGNDFTTGITEDGYATHWQNTQSTGEWTFKTTTASQLIGETPIWSTRFRITPSIIGTQGNIEPEVNITDNLGSVTDAYLYVYSQYVNMNHSTGSRTTDTIFYSSTDNFIRKNDAASFRTSLDVYSKSESDGLGSGVGLTAWCNHNGLTVGTNAPRDGLNVSTVERTALGIYVINFTTAMDNTNYAVSGFPKRASGDGTNNIEIYEDRDYVRTTTSFGVQTRSTSQSALKDVEVLSIMVTGGVA